MDRLTPLASPVLNICVILGCFEKFGLWSKSYVNSNDFTFKGNQGCMLNRIFMALQPPPGGQSTRRTNFCWGTTRM